MAGDSRKTGLFPYCTVPRRCSIATDSASGLDAVYHITIALLCSGYVFESRVSTDLRYRVGHGWELIMMGQVLLADTPDIYITIIYFNLGRYFRPLHCLVSASSRYEVRL